MTTPIYRPLYTPRKKKKLSIGDLICRLIILSKRAHLISFISNIEQEKKFENVFSFKYKNQFRYNAKYTHDLRLLINNFGPRLLNICSYSFFLSNSPLFFSY